MKIKTKRAGVATLIPDKTDFKTKAITRNEGLSNSISGYLLEEIQDTKLKIHTHLCLLQYYYNSHDMEVT